MANLEDVFGIRVKPVQSYVERAAVDGAFRSALRGDKHIVVYGSSKQGKTALRSKHLKPEQMVEVRCAPRHTTESIYRSLLRQLGVQLKVSETSMRTMSGTLEVRSSFEATIPFLSGGAGGTAQGGAQLSEVMATEFVGYDLGDAQAIGELLRKARLSPFIVLENFHYLPPETQQAIAFDLKTFHELGIRFIVLGIWKEANRLSQHNGDLADRIVEIPVEPWLSSDFERVIDAGSGLLNVTLAPVVRAGFVQKSFGNIGMLQEFLRTLCEIEGVRATATGQSPRVIPAEPETLARVFAARLEEQRGRLATILRSIAGKSRTDRAEPLILPYYLAIVVLQTPVQELINGIHRSVLLEKLRAVHHRTEKETIRPGDVVHLLGRLGALQVGIQPPFLHYDSNDQRLKVVDSGQFFVLDGVNREELAEEIPDPLEGGQDQD